MFFIYLNNYNIRNNDFNIDNLRHFYYFTLITTTNNLVY